MWILRDGSFYNLVLATIKIWQLYCPLHRPQTLYFTKCHLLYQQKNAFPLIALISYFALQNQWWSIFTLISLVFVQKLSHLIKCYHNYSFATLCSRVAFHCLISFLHFSLTWLFTNRCFFHCYPRSEFLVVYHYKNSLVIKIAVFSNFPLLVELYLSDTLIL